MTKTEMVWIDKKEGLSLSTKLEVKEIKHVGGFVYIGGMVTNDMQLSY